ncbi:hypothetical protein HBI56_177980 [Parastagonospora nodorum]|uniref:Uncharacterized protein n=2 Tax=Phaeosphaeria nodorum (strain SN15 / ATCC MYA-4574 / FGSC 10173) TaxID=321614 RepID=A0A7U2ETQ7_PHANO|nr:hypothetical protein SNOG_08395 [Parastagonospora nodorum SN15]KAH3917973.1 hypothetical protein HBH56_047330 [Parastagonospora nodorum]EAT84671.1 hypothetical protein SNOG_08395 [Parastagonospora nodorum SN15]KAH3933059.1 hypothetical protein HBH54_075070 [Parastagonospora nodorum]KAH3938830.1 hypothetical protein HBH53_244520 [Parastagonospora nodorum]KAH3957325.1 hypothetical protein HBH51_226440 [Parastagonospora nodorum]
MKTFQYRASFDEPQQVLLERARPCKAHPPQNGTTNGRGTRSIPTQSPKPALGSSLEEAPQPPTPLSWTMSSRLGQSNEGQSTSQSLTHTPAISTSPKFGSIPSLGNTREIPPSKHEKIGQALPTPGSAKVNGHTVPLLSLWPQRKTESNQMSRSVSAPMMSRPIDSATVRTTLKANQTSISACEKATVTLSSMFVRLSRTSSESDRLKESQAAPKRSEDRKRKREREEDGSRRAS